MHDLAHEIAEAIETGHSELRVYEYVSDLIDPPAAWLSFPEVVYDLDAEDSYVANFRVHVAVSRASDRGAYKALTPYLRAGGIKASIETDPTLGGKADSVRVSRSSVAPLTIAGMDYLGATFEVEVYVALSEEGMS